MRIVIALGGNALLFHATELRFPLVGDNIRGVIFHDLGNVYSNLNSISFRFHQRDITDFNYMVHAAGFGVRYRTPVGPVRADFAYKPRMPDHPSTGGAPHLQRRLGLLQATALNMSNMVGVGPFITIPLFLATMGGPQAMIGWVAAAVLVLCDGLVWSELGAALPGSGGTYHFLRQIFGRYRWGRISSVQLAMHSSEALRAPAAGVQSRR